MNKTLFVAVLALTAVSAHAQDMKTFASSAEVEAMIAKAKADIKPGLADISQSVVALAPYDVTVDYRVAGGGPSFHPREAEFIFIMDGTGSFLMGGTMKDKQGKQTTEVKDAVIEGARTYPLTKGDFIFVPQATPHQVLTVNGTMTLMAIHVPRQ